MKLIFVAGPYRDPRGPFYIHANIEAARVVAAEWWQRGWAVLCPHMNTAMMDGLMPDQAFLDGALEMLKRCDAIVLMPNWSESEGALAEEALATKLGLPIYVYGRDCLLLRPDPGSFFRPDEGYPNA